MKLTRLSIPFLIGSVALTACGSTTSSSGGSQAASNGPQPKICILAQFKTRADGVPGLQVKYGAVWAKLKYTEVAKTTEQNLAQNQCDVGEVFTTDSGIVVNNLAVLQDDKMLFPPDNVGFIVRSEVLKAHPELSAIIDPVAAKVTTDEIKKLNKMVEIDNQKPADVVKTWLAANAPPAGGSSTSGPGTANCPAPTGAPTATSGAGATINLGSKNFAEEQILAEIAKQSLEPHGYTVVYTTQEADPQIGQDLVASKIDIYPQYTGTEFQTYLNIDTPPTTDLDQAFTKVQQLDDARNLCWIGKTPMNDTNGLAVRQADTAKFGTTLSQFTTYLNSNSA